MKYETVNDKLITGKGLLLLSLMAVGGISFLARFVLGLGGSTNLSDTYPWGLWIVFDLVWIALAAGAFATAGIVYIFNAEKVHALARPAVWLGFLSYNFVVVTLLADLGLPWHFWQLGIQRPEHSAMFEVSWCVALYVTVLTLEFTPAVFDLFEKHWPPTKGPWTRLPVPVLGFIKGIVNPIPWGSIRNMWKKWAPVYTVIALAFFTYIMSHKVYMALIAMAVFGSIAWMFRKPSDEGNPPIILIVAAVTFSSMHQSSLGSLFLLMPDKLSPLWWSPIMSLYFFLSSIASGIALIIFMDLMISRYFKRPVQTQMLGHFGKWMWGALAIYMAVRIGDIIARGKLGMALTGPGSSLFILEVGLGGLVPLALFMFKGIRESKAGLYAGSLLTLGGIVLNRLNVVILGMHLHGTAPYIAPATYFPSFVEIMVSVSLVAACIFFFSIGTKLLPILPKLGTEK
jgi:formate dehydrogenase iron-sulfur subunit